MIGCTKDVYDQEQTWYKKGFKFGKIWSIDQTRLLIKRSFNSSTKSFDQKTIKGQFLEKFGEAVDPSIVSRAFKTYQDAQFIKSGPINGKKKSKNQNRQQRIEYNASDYLLLLQRLVVKPIARRLIFDKLKKSGILLKYLTLCNYTWRIIRGDMNVDEMVEVFKTKGPVEQIEIDEFRSEYIEQQRFLRTKTNNQIHSDSIISAKKEIESLDLFDPIYTEFFIKGGMFYLANDLA